MRHLLIPVLLLTTAFAQQGNMVNISAAGAPAGTCSLFMRFTDTTTGNEYNCLNGSWNRVNAPIPVLTDSTGNTAAVGTTNLMVSPTAGIYAIYWDLRSTATGSAGTLTGLTFGWNNGSAKTINAFTLGTLVLDLTANNSEISGLTVVSVASGNVTWSTTVGVAIIGNPTYTVKFRVVPLG